LPENLFSGLACGGTPVIVSSRKGVELKQLANEWLSSPRPTASVPIVPGIPDVELNQSFTDFCGFPVLASDLLLCIATKEEHEAE
jgi:hypothetical protein